MKTTASSPSIIVALDEADITAARHVVSQLDPALCRLKIGNILFTQYGPRIVEEFQTRGFSIFLDLKFHDIPQTVAGACRSAAALGVWMVNVHVQSGRAALDAACTTLSAIPEKKRPLLIGVTALTSLAQSDFQTMGITTDLSTWVCQMTALVHSAGFNGVVCSVHEVALLRLQFPKPFVLVTPGIRLENAEKAANDDQKRTATPKEAYQLGSDYLVIGRPITQAKSPGDALRKIARVSYLAEAE